MRQKRKRHPAIEDIENRAQALKRRRQLFEAARTATPEQVRELIWVDRLLMQIWSRKKNEPPPLSHRLGELGIELRRTPPKPEAPAKAVRLEMLRAVHTREQCLELRRQLFETARTASPERLQELIRLDRSCMQGFERLEDEPPPLAWRIGELKAFKHVLLEDPREAE